MKKRLIVKLLLLVSFLIPATLGCGMRQTHSNHILDWPQGDMHRFGDRIDSKQRARLAKSKWQNNVLDPEPILIDVFLTTCIEGLEGEGIERSYLVLTTFDEDADIVGIAIEEEHVDSNGVRSTLLEKYPVFFHLGDQDVTGLRAIPVLTRSRKERKPKDQWQKYLSTPRQQLFENYMKQLKSNFRGTYQSGFWRDTLPPIWISIPEPNKITVRLCAYDRADHLSEQVSLVYEHKKK